MDDKNLLIFVLLIVIVCMVFGWNILTVVCAIVVGIISGTMISLNYINTPKDIRTGIGSVLMSVGEGCILALLLPLFGWNPVLFWVLFIVSFALGTVVAFGLQ